MHKVEKIGPVEAFVLPNPVVIETSKMVSIPATEAAAAPAVEQKVDILVRNRLMVEFILCVR